MGEFVRSVVYLASKLSELSIMKRSIAGVEFTNGDGPVVRLRRVSL